MKHSFWRISIYVTCRSAYRSRCKPCVQRWSFLADWKRLMLQKGFSHGFWCTRDTWSFFVSNRVCFSNKGKCFTLLSQSAFFFPSSYHICDPCLWTCPQKNICIAKWLLLLKKRLKYESWKKTKSLAEKKRVVFQKTFWTSTRKTGNFEGIVFFLCLVNEISQKSFPNKYRSVEARFILSKETLKDRQRICFLFVDWANWKLFFCGRNVSCLKCFFLSLKERF